MPKKKILFGTWNLAAGGGQKSLVSLLNTIDTDRYDIDLLLMGKWGLFLPQVPEWVNVIEAEDNFAVLHISPTNLAYFRKRGIVFWLKVVFSRLKARMLYKNLNKGQAYWKTWKKHISSLPCEYDCAISFIERDMNYFIMDKVRAKRKLLWIHTVYTSLGQNPAFDYEYFKRADHVCTMSETGLKSLQETFPTIKDKFIVLENISNGKLIAKLSMVPVKEKEYSGFKGLKLLSVGRLDDVKNYSLAIDAAKELCSRDINLLWYVIGEGGQRPILEEKIKAHGLSNSFKLIGLRENPYQYMRVADMVVMTSKFEGRSIALDEAKILHKLIVTTNYTSATDVVTDGETGLICEMSPASVADAILRLYNGKPLADKIIHNLESTNWDNTREVEKYYKVIDGEI